MSHKMKFHVCCLYVICSLIMVLTSVLCVQAADGTDGQSEKTVLYYGHRGYTGKYPENTLQSLKGAMAAGFDGVEFDVFETKSHQLMVFHDTSLQRMCGVSGTIYQVNKSNRKDYPITSGKNIDRYEQGTIVIPTFREVVRAMAKRDALMCINLKGCLNYTEQGIRKMINILEEYDMAENSVIFCGNISLLKKFSAQGMHVGYLDTSANRDRAKEKLKKAIRNEIECYIEFLPSCLSASMVRLCHKKGMTVGVYKVRTMAEAERLRRIGVDFMFNYDYLWK